LCDLARLTARPDCVRWSAARSATLSLPEQDLPANVRITTAPFSGLRSESDEGTEPGQPEAEGQAHRVRSEVVTSPSPTTAIEVGLSPVNPTTNSTGSSPWKPRSLGESAPASIVIVSVS